MALLETQYAVLQQELTVASLEYGKLLEGLVLIRQLGGGYQESR
jgi:hypothetical protein